MDETYKTKKYATDKVALLGLFIVALLIGRFIVASRSAILLSEPIKLEHTGLSVSMPAGNGWQNEKQWKYQENTFVLSSVFVPGSGSVTALAHCRYILAGTNDAVDTRFEQKASAGGASVAKTGQTRTDSLVIDWAHIKKQKTPLEMFFGTAQLPNNRQLNIEVHQAAGDTDLAEQVFKRIVENLKFENNQLLEAGSEIVAEIKNEGLDSFFHDQSRQSFYLIKDARKRTIGFMMDVLIDSGLDTQLNIQSAGLYYIRGRYASEQVTLFQGSNSFNEFTWKSETSTADSRSGTELILDKAGVMTVRKLRPQAEEKKYQLNSAAIPEVFLELIFSQILDSYHKEIVVDTIEAEGTIMPRFISRIEAEDRFTPAEAGAAEKEAAYVLRVEFLSGQGFSERIYLDNQKQISKILVETPKVTKGVWRPLQRKGVYILERTNIKDILRQFPKQADYILQKNKMLEQSQPQY